MQITKSVNSETKEKKSSDTMGMKHKIYSALYVIKGSINHQLAEKTGFSDEDAEKIKEALRTLFVNDSENQDPMEAWRYAKYTGGGIIVRWASILRQRFIS